MVPEHDHGRRHPPRIRRSRKDLLHLSVLSEKQTMARALVLVHGLFSSGKTWSRLRTRIAGDTDLVGLEIREFGYYSPKLHFSPLKAIPDYDDVANKLWTWITVTLDSSGR